MILASSTQRLHNASSLQTASDTHGEYPFHITGAAFALGAEKIAAQGQRLAFAGVQRAGQNNSLQIAKEKRRPFEAAQLRGDASPLPTKTPLGKVLNE